MDYEFMTKDFKEIPNSEVLLSLLYILVVLILLVLFRINAFLVHCKNTLKRRRNWRSG